MKKSTSLSSLRKLERQNHSKSTVSSSDTDVDSAGYVSSSGTTTPEDDAQTFHLGPTLQNLLVNKSRDDPGEKPTVVGKHHNLSSAVKKVKKVAHVLTVFKKKKSDDNAPIVMSSPLRERFGKRMAVRPHPEAFYSLPNRRFSLSDVSAPSRRYHPETITRKFGTISGSTSSFNKDGFRKQRSLPNFPSSRHSSTHRHPTPIPTPAPPVPPVPRVSQSERSVLTFNSFLVFFVRLLLFIPWCATVGGALLLFPSYVELVAFGPQYIVSPKGIRRFAHWAECGQQHVMIFLASLLAILWYNCALGISLAIVAASRFVYVWHGFKLDRSIPLGDDDQQSFYLVVTGQASADNSFRTIRRGSEDH